MFPSFRIERWGMKRLSRDEKARLDFRYFMDMSPPPILSLNQSFPYTYVENGQRLFSFPSQSFFFLQAK